MLFEEWTAETHKQKKKQKKTKKTKNKKKKKKKNLTMRRLVKTSSFNKRFLGDIQAGNSLVHFLQDF